MCLVPSGWMWTICSWMLASRAGTLEGASISAVCTGFPVLRLKNLRWTAASTIGVWFLSRMPRTNLLSPTTCSQVRITGFQSVSLTTTVLGSFDLPQAASRAAAKGSVRKARRLVVMFTKNVSTGATSVC